MLDELQRLVDKLALELHRSVAIDDPNIQLIVASAHYGAIDRARTQNVLTRRTDPRMVTYVQSLNLAHARHYVRVPAHEELEALPRIAIPLRDSHATYGYLWLIDYDPPVSDTELERTMRCAVTATELLAQDSAHTDERLQQDSHLLTELFSHDPNRSDTALQEAHTRGLLDSAAPLQVAVANLGYGPTAAGRAHLAAASRSIRMHQIFDRALVGPAEDRLLLATTTEPQHASDVSRRIHRVLTHSNINVPALGVGECQPGETPEVACRRAEYAAHLAGAVPSFAGVAQWSTLGPWQLLFGLPWTRATVEQLHPPIAPLLREENENLATTLLAYLESGGSASTTVEHLHIHRTTLYYRMDKIRDLIGDEWTTGWGRIGAHAALVLLRSMPGGHSHHQANPGGPPHSSSRRVPASLEAGAGPA